MHDIKVIRKRVPCQGKPVCESKEFYSINGGDTWMTYSQYFHWGEAVFGKVWKQYSAHDIKKHVEACLVAYNVKLREDLLGGELLPCIQELLKEDKLLPCDISFNIINNCTDNA
jgi:hypothetical protein